MKKIVLMCNAGMSTSILVSKMRNAALEKGYDCVIEACSVQEAKDKASDADIVLLGPQVRFELKKVQAVVTCPVEVIDMSSYGMMDGARVLNSAIDVIGK